MFFFPPLFSSFFVKVLALFEFTAGGDIIPSLRVRVYKRVNYDDHKTWVLLILDLLVLLFFIRYLFIEVKEFQSLWMIDQNKINAQLLKYEEHRNAMRRSRKRGDTSSSTIDLEPAINTSKCSRIKRVAYAYTADLWNFVDLCSLGIYFGSIGWRFLQFLDPIRKYQLDQLNLEFYQLNKQSQSYAIANKMYGVVVLLCLFQVLKFAAMSTKVNLMWLTIHRSVLQLGIFLSFFITVYIAYVLAGHIIFGPEVYEFSTFALSLRTYVADLYGRNINLK